MFSWGRVGEEPVVLLGLRAFFGLRDGVLGDPSKPGARVVEEKQE